MISDELMIIGRHLVDSLSRIGKQRLRRIKRLSWCKLPAKILRSYSGLPPHTVKLVHLCLHIKIPGIHHLHAVNLPLIPGAVLGHQRHKGMILMA